MHFKKLEIIGFKSFANKTEILFEPGVTAVVGPNGCGKSNISDSIRWVLGEQSAKSLRGSSMEDVIFNGAADREPLNFAEVSLTLSNETRLLAVDYDEVTISRRLYRSGESEYLLNKNLVRLKDIHEMLLGTGIGTESYSVIEQGKMDAVLNSKPDERRAIFEEAAGITKFKAKKKEALRKLEQTDQNLLRINDIIQEVKRQISTVERQAKKAEQYKIEFEKMKKLELGVAGKEFLLFDQDRRSKEDQLQSLKAEEKSCHDAVSEIDARCREKRSELDRVEASLSEANSKEVMAQADMRQKQDRILMNRERTGELLERKGNIEREIEGIKARLAGFHAEYEKLEQSFAAALEEEKAGQGILDSAEAELRAADEGYRAASSDEVSCRQKMNDASRRRNQFESQIAKCRAEMAAVGNRSRRIRADQDNLLKEIREIDEKLSPTLFEGAEVSALESKVREWRDKLLGLFRGWLGRGLPQLETEDEAEFDRELRRFADEVGRLQGTVDHREIESRHFREARERLEKRLASLDTELHDLQSEEIVQRENEREQEAGLSALSEEERGFEGVLAQAQQSARERQEAKEKVLVRVAEVRSRQASFTDRRLQAEKDKNWIVETERGQKELAETLAREAEESVGRRQTLEAESAALADEIVQISGQRDGILRQVEALRREREGIHAIVSEMEAERRQKQEFLDAARDKVHGFEMQSAEIRFAMDRLKERIFNAYQVDLVLDNERSEAEGAANEQVSPEPIEDIDTAKAEIAKLRDKLAKMGPVNLVAIEEHQEMSERYTFLTQQEADLLKAKDDLHKAIQKINRTTKELFAETFAKVQQYFAEYFKLLFGGGQAELVLLDEQDILESGIEIVARPPGKKLQNITLLSGGEKALTAVALVFSLFKVRPSPFCILDEIDAPLDETNVDRFCGVLKDFITTSQFILITHNKRTMNLADAIYGVTMAQTGISNVVSVKFSQRDSKKEEGAKAL